MTFAGSNLFLRGNVKTGLRIYSVLVVFASKVHLLLYTGTAVYHDFRLIIAKSGFTKNYIEMF